MKNNHEDFTEFADPSTASIERLIRSLDRAYHNPGQLLWRSFLQGMMAAIGAVVGTALIGALSVYLFQILGGFTVVKNSVQNFEKEFIQSVQKP